MSAIAAINSQVSTSFASPVAPSGAATGSTSVQTSALVGMAQDGSSIESLAALALALLLQKSSESKEAEDPWKMLVGMAMLGMLGRSSDGAAISQSSSTLIQAYGPQCAAAATSGFTAQA